MSKIHARPSAKLGVRILSGARRGFGTDATLIRFPMTPSCENGLQHPPQIMVDKAAPMRREKIELRTSRQLHFIPMRINAAPRLMPTPHETR